MSNIFLLRRIANWTRRIADLTRVRLSPRDPVTVFHHIPKCGGTSFRGVLRDWFLVIDDYRVGWDREHPPRIDTSRLRSGHCLSGHFELEGAYLHQRYPEVLDSPRFRLITVVREPLDLRLSLYRYEKRNQVLTANSIEDHLFRDPNYLANRFPTGREHLGKTLDRYDFIGTLEDPQLTLDVLAWKLGKPRAVVPHENATRKGTSFPLSELSPHVIERFREENSLDYAIYHEAQRSFGELREAYRDETGR